MSAPRRCGFCGGVDQLWHGLPAAGWTKLLGLDRCPTCTFLENEDPLPQETDR